MYIVIEITHDKALGKPPYARVQRYASGEARIWRDFERAKQEARSAMDDPHNGVVRTIVERI